MTEMKTLQPGIDFIFLVNESDKDDDAAIQITTGKFENVIYRINKVWVDPDQENGIKEDEDMVVNFDYTVIENLGNENLHKDLEFQNHISNILQTIILEGINRAMAEEKANT